MKLKSVFVGIAAVFVVLLFLSIASVSRVLSASPGDLSQGSTANPVAAKFLPKRSPFVASLLVNPDRLSLYAELAAKPGDRASLKSELRTLKQQIKQVWALDYDKNIKPWLGDEITLAVTTSDIDRQADNGLQPGYLIALAVKKPDIAKKSLEAFWQSLAIAGSDLAFEQYQGVSILHANATETKPSLAGATLGKFALFANDAKVIRNAINDLQVPDLALANLDIYQNSLQSLAKAKISSAFVNLEELGLWNGSTAKLPKAGLALGLGLDKIGINAETVLIADAMPSFPPTSPANSTKDNQHQAINYIPVGSSLITGRDLGQTWAQIEALLLSYPDLHSSVMQAIASVEKGSGFNLVDVITSVKGEYAIGLLPGQDSDLNWVFVAQNTDSQLADDAIARLDNAARTTANLTVGEVPVNDRQLTVWTRLSAVAPKSTSKSKDASVVTGTIAAVHSQTPEYIFLANSINAIESALNSDITPITKSSTFKAIADLLPRNHQVYAYIDSKNALTTLGQKLPILSVNQTLIEPLKPLVPHIKAVNLTSVAKSNGDPATIQRGEIFIALQ